MPVRALTGRVRRTLTGLLKGTADVAASSMQVAYDATVRSLRGGGRKRELSSGLAQDTIEGALRAGSDTGTELAPVAKGAVKGVVLGMGSVGKFSASVVADSVRAAVWATGEVGGDIGTVTRKAVEGGIEGAKQLGMTAEEAAAAASIGALEAAASLGAVALKAVDKALTGTISGVRMAVGAVGPPPRVLIVDTNRANLDLLSQRLSREGFLTVGATSLEELDNLITREDGIDMALVDLSGFDQAIWEKCEALRSARIPFIVISPQRSPAVQRDSLKHGASGVLAKPLGIPELADHIRMLVGD